MNSPRAIEVNIRIIRIFTRLREMIMTNKDILLKLEQLEKKIIQHDDEIRQIFMALKGLLKTPERPRTPIGFKIGG